MLLGIVIDEKLRLMPVTDGGGPMTIACAFCGKALTDTKQAASATVGQCLTARLNTLLEIARGAAAFIRRLSSCAKKMTPPLTPDYQPRAPGDERASALPKV